ncbi:hypothetical protein QZH41_003947 [Actinostola sp. cb2023]|nr:hypothetical protein QZH41_003947 [Actinostola sp. cb2023]
MQGRKEGSRKEGNKARGQERKQAGREEGKEGRREAGMKGRRQGRKEGSREEGKKVRRQERERSREEGKKARTEAGRKGRRQERKERSREEGKKARKEGGKLGGREYAFSKSLFCDVEFSVVESNGDKVTIPANKYILAISSPVFEAMFYGQLAETRPTIDLPDCTKEGLHELLRYAHSDEVNLTGSNVMEVLYLADKYMMPFLVTKCRDYIEDQLSSEDVFSILPAISKMGDENLAKHCWSIIDSETQRAVTSQAFLDIPRELLCQVLGRDGLKIKELDLFQAVDQWVSKKVQAEGLYNNGETKRAILGEEVIRLVRFPLMSLKEFTEVVLSGDILDKNEVTELIQLFSSSPTVTTFFSIKERSARDRLLIPNNRFATIQSVSFDGWRFSCIDFRVNKAVALVGARLFGSEGQSHQLNVSIHKIEPFDIKLKSQFLSTGKTEKDQIDGLYYGFTVFLREPMKVYPGFQYRIGFDVKGPHSYVGLDGKTCVEFEDFKTSNNSKGKEYEPGTLQTYRNGLRRYFLERPCPPAIDNNFDLDKTGSAEFEEVATMLSLKKKDLKKKGLGNKPNAADPVEAEDLEKMWSSGDVGLQNPRSLIRLVWWNNVTHLGMRACKEQHDCQLEDFVVRDQYIEYTERQTKNRQGDEGKAKRARKYNNKLWKTDGGERDPYRAFMEYVSHRPKGDDVPNNFYLTPIDNTTSGVWYKSIPIGVNTLSKMMKQIADKAGLKGKFTNSSGRKTTVQLLRDEFHPLEISELTGHANPESITSYSHNPLEKQRQMSNTLSGFRNPSSSTLYGSSVRWSVIYAYAYGASATGERSCCPKI